jgi:hypothetical protein
MRDYQVQLSIYAWMLEQTGFEVEKIANILIFRDWKKSDVEKVPKPYATIYHEKLTEIDGKPIQLWIDERIELFDKNMDVPDELLPYCSEEFRWAQPDTWAVKKNSNKTAVRVFNTKEEAQEYIKNISDVKNKYWIEQRIGDKYKRCEYCSIHDFCNQYKEGMKEAKK